MRVLLISTYEMGRQPFGLASPAAWLRRAGARVQCLDLTREPLDELAVRQADLVGFHLPMHTATRLAVPVISRVRRLNPRAHLCCYGIYAPLNAPLLRSLGVHSILDGEFEEGLAALAEAAPASSRDAAPEGSRVGTSHPSRIPNPALRGSVLPRLQFLVPERTGLPALDRYAALRLPDGELRTVGYTEASRGCKHLCRHCPIVPVYQGAFRIVQSDVVLEDIRRQVAAGARHITFGDPDFFNGVGHALQIIRALPSIRPGLTYDVTIKVEHLLRQRAHLAELRETGCLFVTSAVESIDDTVLAKLQKGHTRADFARAAAACREAGLSLRPTFVAFTPWITVEGYCDLLREIERLDLVAEVAPIQLAIRLLIPERSLLLELPDVPALVGAFDPDLLAYPWRHPDARVDALQRDVMGIVAARGADGRAETFEDVFALARARAGCANEARSHGIRPRTAVPFLNEPWYC